MTANKRRFSWGAVLLVLLAMCLVYYLASGLRSQDAVSYAQVRQLFLDEKVQEFAISDTRLTAKLSDGSTVSCDLYDFQVFYDDLNGLVQQQHDQGIIRDYTYHADHSTNWLKLLLPYAVGGMVAALHDTAQVLSSSYTENGIELDAIVDETLFGRLRQYVTEEV